MAEKNLQLSVVLAVYNEQTQIADCLKSVAKIADEVIIIDGESEDDTVKIAQKFGAKIFTVPNKPNDFHANKQLGIDQAKSKWILHLDADERVSKALAKKITQVISSPSTYQGYKVARKNWFLGRFLTKGGAYPDYVLRLFQNGKGRFPDQKIIDNHITTSNVHAQLQVDGQVGEIDQPILHYGDLKIDRYLNRFNRYTSLEAINLYRLGDRPGLAKLFQLVLYKPAYWFLARYFRHRGYVDGFSGFLFALFSALHYPVIYLKLWEIDNVQRRN